MLAVLALGGGQALAQMKVGNQPTALATDANFQVESGTQAAPVQFFINKNSGNVGIGTTSPGARLHVDSGTNGTSGVRISRVTNAQLLGTDASGNIINKSEVGFGAGFLSISDNPLSFSGARLRLNGDNGGVQPNYFEFVNDTSRLFVNFDNRDLVYITPTTNGWVAASDRRKKDRINTLDGVLSKLEATRGVSYVSRAGGGLQIGVIAQEVQEVFPEAVQESQDGMLSVSYNSISAINLQAVKELKTLLDEQRREIDALKAEMARYRAAGAATTAAGAPSSEPATVPQAVAAEGR